MKHLILLTLIAGAYFLYTRHSPFQTEVTDPYFAEVRITLGDTGVSLVGYGKMNSLEDCQARAALVWVETFKEIGETQAETDCSRELPERYRRVFDNQSISATYLSFDKGSDRERDGRFVIYGIPSSIVAGECSKLIERARRTYTGKIYCVQGTVG
ncbi:MAG: hypothetical protein FIA97_13420 [Methylococcaceae bacterium]|nr:hypothetical protein [Methylococcaceae bacterium]